MKKFTFQIRSLMQPNIISLILLGFGFIELHAQNSPTDIIPVGSTVKKLSSDQFSFAEGPVWYGDSILLFTSYISSGNTSQINSYNPVENKFSIFRNNINANGLTLDMNKNLLSTEGTSVVMLNETGAVTKVLAAVYNDKHFNGPNDLIADKKGGVYFSDPVYFVTPSQDKECVYYIDATGNVKRIIDDLAKPNGLILSPDGKKLYVVDSDNKYLYSWDVAPDGSVTGKLSMAELQCKTGTASGADGMAIDIYGNIYVSSDIGVQIFSPDGAVLTTLLLPEKVTNCDFGGTDFKTLYITVATNLYSIDLSYPGYAVSRNAVTLGITQIADKPQVKVYPDPVTDVLHVELKTDKLSSFVILGMDGKTESVNLKNNVGKDVEINTQKLKPGFYILRIIVGEGVLSAKFIKK